MSRYKVTEAQMYWSRSNPVKASITVKNQWSKKHQTEKSEYAEHVKALITGWAQYQGHAISAV